jgi:small subunit ribosomal protein S15
MDKATKTAAITKYAIKEGDTGSADVQVAVLTERIKEMTEHLKTHRKDVHSRRGLVAMVTRRRKLLNYLSRTAPERYAKLRTELNVRHNI